ncbi:GNAT family N-acetyltransferase [Occultella glacieicola]|uniref:GNAT family N-acetyltransferase n=1 Tax=Occultella glacieicola TaxID=2518684 RepID=A0ABY2E3X8_9MICO|nr:GNAT family N-acetyltransferase [Occultella glacieicola]TDE92573.1 GNAT family N-acetyltransferase [Occultella glacieicola]
MTLARDSADAADIIGLRDRLAHWQESIGITQWRVGEVSAFVVERQVAAGEWYLMRHGTQLIATARVLTRDEHTWGPDLGAEGSAGYLHGLMVTRSAAGRGLGGRILEWFCELSASHRLPAARLDCVASNPRLRRYYLDQGFTERGITDFGESSGWAPVRRFERLLAAPTGLSTGRRRGV